ncbi:MAG TPA: 1-(5-phosphoribosyl)-5-[(5-phosphoribosylamino)methylideneamino]imidazole-4-carboxamide isomerase [Nitrospirales bacterium]
MIVIPAIDLKDGRCVRLRQGQMEHETVYSNDAAQVARQWESEGAQLLHVVDLNGALHGEPRNRSAVEAILKAVSIPVQVGGGIRDLDTMENYFSLGVARVVLGTAVSGNLELLEKACARFPGRLLAGVDAKDGKLAIRGWTEIVDQEATAFVERFKGYPLHAVIYTDIGRDGMLDGPNFQGLKRMASACPLPLIASGGISKVEDLLQIRELGAKIIGAIVGKALYEGLIELPAAMAAVA